MNHILTIKGNFGEVYKGYWGETLVALKKLKSMEFYMEFLQEAHLIL
jgi:hypothetical protein